jgi:hypothetical protein
LSRAIPQNISYKTASPVRQFITSGTAGETVPDQSIFRRQFISALQGEGDTDKDGYVTALELGEFLQKTVVNYSKNAQHPQYGKIRNPNLDKGDFVFVLPKAARETQVATSSQSRPSSSEAPKTIRADEEVWLGIKNSIDPEDFRFFLEEFPESSLAKSARFKMKRLQRKQDKVKAEKKLADEVRRLEEKRKRLEAEKHESAVLITKKEPKSTQLRPSNDLKPKGLYFTLDSNSEEVLQAQGNPEKIEDWGIFKKWFYGRSNVHISKQRVVGWENTDGNLRLK